MSEEQKSSLDDIELNKVGDRMVHALSVALGRQVSIYLAVVDVEVGQVQTTTNMADPADFIGFLHTQTQTGQFDMEEFKPTVN